MCPSPHEDRAQPAVKPWTEAVWKSCGWCRMQEGRVCEQATCARPQLTTVYTSEPMLPLWEDLDIWGAHGYLWGSWQGSLLVATLGGVVGQSPTVWTGGAILVADMVPNRLPTKVAVSRHWLASSHYEPSPWNLTPPRWQSTVVHRCSGMAICGCVCKSTGAHNVPDVHDDLLLGLPGGSSPQAYFPAVQVSALGWNPSLALCTPTAAAAREAPGSDPEGLGPGGRGRTVGQCRAAAQEATDLTSDLGGVGAPQRPRPAQGQG